MSSQRSWRDRLSQRRQSVRRAVLSRRRVLSALFAGAAVVAGLNAAAAPPPDRVQVLTATRDLPGGTVLTAADVALSEFSPDSVPAGSVSADDAIGRTAAAPLRRGEPVTDVRLVADRLMSGYPGLTAVPVRIPDADAVELLRVGDRINLVASDPQGAEQAHAVATDVPVIAIPKSNPASSVSGSGNGLGGRLIVVGTTSVISEDLADAAVQAFLSITFSR